MNLYVLPKLPYAFDALEPFIDQKTMQVHHGAHHKSYVDKLNAALEPFPKFHKKLEELLVADLSELPEAARTAVRNNGGGHANHTLFWSLLAPKDKASKTAPSDELKRAIESSFGSEQAFRERFTDVSIKHFSNGWAWLCAGSDGKLQCLSTKDHETPLTSGLTPLLVLDLWEHAYYLKYQSRRPEFVEAFWNIVDWSEVAARWDEFRRNGTSTREWRLAA